MLPGRSSGRRLQAAVGDERKQRQATASPRSSNERVTRPTFFSSENLTTNSFSSASPATGEDCVSLVNSGAEVTKRATVSKSGSFKEEHMKPGKKVQPIPQHQVGGQSTAISSSSSLSPIHHTSLDSGVPETLKSSAPSSGTKKEVLETCEKVVPAAIAVDAPGCPSQSGSGEEGLKSIETTGTETNSGSLKEHMDVYFDPMSRLSNNQKGLIPSPQTPMQVMHKAETKYEVGKVTDEEQAKQRRLKGILNKLTPQNFEKLFEQVKQVNIDNARTLSGVVAQIFDKALMEPALCEMYANVCSRLAVELPDFNEDNERITFKRLLLNKCQEEFERGEREQEEANRTEEEGEVKQSEEEWEEKRIKARRSMLGNIRLIGELYKKKMLTERIMHECIKKLLGPDKEDIEALCILMSTIGAMMDQPKAKERMDVYFDTMSRLSNNMKLSSNVRFMLKDVIDLRKNKWQQRRKVEGQKKIEEVHRDAAQ